MRNLLKFDRKSIDFDLNNSFLITVVLMRYVETPVPIPNTEVKRISVDDTGSIRAGKVG